MGILKSIKEFFLGKDEAPRPAAPGTAPRPVMRPLPPPRPGMARPPMPAQRPGTMPPRPITPIYRPLPPGARPAMRPLPPPRPGVRPAVFAPPYSTVRAPQKPAKRPVKAVAKKKKAAPKRKKRK